MLVKFNKDSDVRYASTCIHTSDEKSYHIVFLRDITYPSNEFSEVITYEALPSVIKHMIKEAYGKQDNDN